MELQFVSAENILTVYYESFVNEPHAFLDKLAKRIDINKSAWDSAINQNVISRKNVGKGKSALSAREIEQIAPYIEAGQGLLGMKALSGA